MIVPVGDINSDDFQDVSWIIISRFEGELQGNDMSGIPFAAVVGVIDNRGEVIGRIYDHLLPPGRPGVLDIQTISLV